MIELGGLSERVGEDARVEATVGALREGEEGFARVAAGSERGVDVDEVPGACTTAATAAVNSCRRSQAVNRSTSSLGRSSSPAA